MRNIEYLEKRQRGTDELPCELYRVDPESGFYRMPCHWHPECEIICVHSGSIALTLDERHTELGAGDIAILNGGTLHSGEPDDCVYDCIVFDREKILKGTLFSSAVFKNNSFGDFIIRAGEDDRISSTVVRLVDTLAELSRCCGDGEVKVLLAQKLVAQGLIAELFGSILLKTPECRCDNTAQENRHIGQLKSVISYIETNYNRQITLNELADSCGLSAKYLCRLFSSVIGSSPIEYINGYRIECACALLVHTERTMLDIASNCGFNDQSYFIKLFKRYKGITPSEYRKRFSFFTEM